MSVLSFIPNVWSENLLNSLDKKYIAVANCNRDFEGDIKQCGSSVTICGVGTISVGDYTKNTDMSSPETVDGELSELVIDRAKYFNFQVDDIDKAQRNPKLLDAAMSNAASALANEADKYVYSLYEEAGHQISAYLDTSTVTSAILAAREKLFKNGVTNAEDIVIEISPAIATALFKEQSETLSFNNDLHATGCIGYVAGCKVFVTNNIFVNEGSIENHYCFARTTRAIAFAEQLSEVEAYRPEKRFADAVKGLHLYGAKVVYPNEFICLNISRNED